MFWYSERVWTSSKGDVEKKQKKRQTWNDVSVPLQPFIRCRAKCLFAHTSAESNRRCTAIASVELREEACERTKTRSKRK